MQENTTFEETVTDFGNSKVASRKEIAGSIVALIVTIASSIGAAWIIAAGV